MAVNYGANAGGKPAVYNQKNTGTLPSDQGPIKDLQAGRDSRDAWTQQLTGSQVSDVNLNAAMHQSSLSTESPLRVGRVVLAMPYIHCYKIQLTGRQGSCVATAVSRNSHSPLGVKAGDVILPNSPVLVWKPNASGMAYILAVLPQPLISDAFNASDMIQQGGNSGPKKVEAYRNIPKSAKMGHNWVSQSCGRPMDGAIGEYVRMSETGIGLLIDSFQSYLRVNEACGLWLNYFDSYAKLVGLSLQIQSYCEHVFQHYDEGELFSLRGYVTYPWEALGMYRSDTKFTKSNGPAEVQLDREFPFASEDLEDQSITPFYRLADYTGYLGQGFNRTLVCPPAESGSRLRTDADSKKDIGLFNEFLTLDGSYGIRSAKQILFAKYPLIPNPRRKRLIEDAKGEDLTEENDYRFSGCYGDGDQHKVLEWDDSEVEDARNLLRPAGVLDLITRHFNWKSTHPFQYHTKDYSYPEEGDNDSPLNEVKFYSGKMSETYVDVSPKRIKIDDRYQDVSYYNTASFFTMNEDGSVVIADGYGSQITMAGGQIRLEAGGDVMLMSGSRVVALAREVITRARDSVDISSSNKDVRIKAEHNLQMLGGNSGSGSVLIESKGKGTSQQYDQSIGEEVRASGIVLLSRGGSVNMMSKTAYIRTGVEEGNAEGSGDLVIDCANGRSKMVSYASAHSFFNSQGFGLWHSPTGKDSIDISKSNFLGPKFSKVNGPTVMTDDVCLISGSLGVANDVLSQGFIGCLGQMACLKGVEGLGDSSKGDFPKETNEFITQFSTFSGMIDRMGSPIFKPSYPEFYWQDSQPGHSALLEDKIGFSYRDESSRNKAYSYSPGKFFLLEPRWQQLERLELTTNSNSTVWTEKPVMYQGEELYPWPGKLNWVDEKSLLQYSELVLFETDKAKSREENKEDYEEPKFKDLEKQVCDGVYKL